MATRLAAVRGSCPVATLCCCFKVKSCTTWAPRCLEQPPHSPGLRLSYFSDVAAIHGRLQSLWRLYTHCLERKLPSYAWLLPKVGSLTVRQGDSQTTIINGQHHASHNYEQGRVRADQHTVLVNICLVCDQPGTFLRTNRTWM